MVNLTRNFVASSSMILLATGLVIFIMLMTQASVDKSEVGFSQSVANDESSVQSIADPDIWPTGMWPTSTPEEQGMDSGLLLNMFDFIAKNRKNIQSLLIVRNGHLLAEAYFDPYRADTKHLLASASKSITAILLGIAIKDGYIRNLDQRMIDFFPEVSEARLDPRKKDITLEHLLTMTAGIDWHETDRSYASTHNSLAQMIEQADWLPFILERPMAAKPGEKFTYNSGLSHLLSAIIQKETGLTAAKYAEMNLFDPLGITDYFWESDPGGITVGGWGLMLTPRDMAKLGYLYLRKGKWEDQAVVPAAWVAESTKRHLDILSNSDLRYKVLERLYRLFRREPPFRHYSYGYHWWVPTFGGYAARGHAGQAIFVIPQLDMVVVITGGLPRSDLFLPEKLMEDHIIPAVRSSEPLPPNQQAMAALHGVLQEYAHPEPKVEPALAATAALISAKQYQVNPNFPGIQSLSFTFSQSSEAGMKIGSNNGSYDLIVGLDGVYRTNQISDHESIALKGHWTNTNTFTVDMLIVSSGKKYEQSFTFLGDEIRITWRGVVEEKVWRMTGHAED